VGWLDIERRERILEGVTISDWGDIRFKYGESVETIFNRAADVILDVVSRGSFPLLIGGDHSVTFPAIKCLQSQHELAVIWLDAHTDFAEITPGAHINHANVARRIADLPNVLKLIHIGYRGYALDEDGEFAGEKVIRITPSDARQKGMDYVLQAVPEGIPCYISIDIDALDPIYAPGTSTPVPGGFSPDQMKSMLRLLGSRRRIAGLDLVEVNPDRDIGAITSRIACQLLLVALGAIKRAGRFFQK
jgi:agmatinase